jgi:hypothetical protein
MIQPALLCIILIMLLSACSTCDKDHCFEPPEPFKFSIIDRNSKEDLIFSDNPRYFLDSIELYYYENEEKIVLALNVTESRQRSNIISNSPLPYVSAVNFIKDFYLQLNYLDTDTLLIDVKEIDFECCWVFQYASSFINGSTLKSSQGDYTVFLVEK